jgi:outer membrane receptor protein involved in Fe transport
MRRITSAALLACISVFGLFGQATDGNLVGMITDASGAAISGAEAKINNRATSIRTTTTSSQSGEYRFNNLPVGSYDLSVSATGFGTMMQTGVAIELNKTATVNISLQVGAVSQTVDVSDAAAAIDTTTAQVQSSFSAQQAKELPASSIGSGVLNLSLLSAGVASSGALGYGTGPSVGGQRPTNNSFSIDGVDNNRKDVTGPVVFISNEAVSEFSLLQNQFSAEFGHSSGGQFNTVIKSGTNVVHGSIYEYLQNRNLNAIDQLFQNQGLKENPRFDNNRLGATAGGPIVKNKWFIYGNYEYNPVGRNSTPAGGVNAPTAGGYAALSGLSGISQTNLGVLKQYLPAAAAATSTTSVSGVAIPIGPIPIVAPNYFNNYDYLISSDFYISDVDQLRGRYVSNRFRGIDNNPTLPAFYTGQTTDAHLASLAEFHTFAPNLTNELRLSYNRFNNPVNTGNFKFPGLDSFPNILIENDLNLQLGPDPNGPQATILNTYQWNDNVNWTKGNHTFKFGYDGRTLIAPQSFVQRSRGDYDYLNLSEFLRDVAPGDLGERSVALSPYSGNQNATYLFANDSWRVRPNLTLTGGVRYEYTTVPVGQRLQSLNAASSVPGLITFDTPKSQKTNFAPRLGVAYSPGKSGNTSIRAGFGLAYDQIYDNLGILSLPPQFTSTYDVTGNETNFLARGGLPGTYTAPATVAQARAATSAFIPDQKLPYAIDWNFGIQHIFAKSYTFEVRYLGTRGVHLPVQQRINRAAVVTPTNFLPTYPSVPTSSQLSGLNLNLGQLLAERNTLSNTYAPYGFSQNITAFEPIGNSSYNGLALQLTRRFTNNLQFVGSYTWSHNIDDSTATVFTTLLTPRRAEDFQNLSRDRGDSILDRRQRFTLSEVYDAPWFRKSGWFLKNVPGNWLVSGTYTFETPEYATVQSGVDSNLNGDAAGDRSIINPAGIATAGSDVYAIDRSGNRVSTGSPSTVAYVAVNPNARYIEAQLGAIANGARNTLATKRINNFDVSLTKKFNITESKRFELAGQFFNLFNHPQATPGSVNDVTPALTSVTTASRNFLQPSNPAFNDFGAFFSSNPRTIQVVCRFIF